MAGKNLGDIAAVNAKYYSSKGKAIYSDFSTFAQGSAIAKANAISFADDFEGTAGEIIICEYGIGNGNFARVFLDEVKKRSPALYSRARYHLFDISEKMIADAKKNLATHSSICEFHAFDAAQELPSMPFDYCRINELLSDLPAEIYMRRNGGIFTPDGKAVAHPPLFAAKFLERIERERQIPFSFVAQEFLSALCGCGKEGFRVDLFDYGFYSADDIFSMPVDEWNRLVARTYGGKSQQEFASIGMRCGAPKFQSNTQITVDLNFLQLCSALAAQGFSARVELQKDYCERVLGIPLELSQTARGLDYVKKKQDDGISEDDGFYHLSIRG